MAANTYPRSSIHRWLFRLPGPAADDVALAALLGGYSVVTTLVNPNQLPGPAWAAVIVAVLQTLPLLWRRSHPGIALALYCATKPVEYAALLPVNEVTWLVLVYSLFAYRRLRTAASVLGLTVLVTYPFSAAALSVALDAGFWFGPRIMIFLVTPQLVVAAVLGWVVRVTRAREIRQRDLAAQARLSAEIDRDRQRIAIELNSVVVDRLKRLVARTEQLREQHAGVSRSAHQVLSEVHDEARQALAAMRRTLGFLRSDRSVPDPAPSRPRGGRWAPPRPTLSGIALAGVFTAVAVLLNNILRWYGMLPERPPANGWFAGIWPFLFLYPEHPWGVVVLFIQFAVVAWWRSAPLTALAVSSIAPLSPYPDHFLATNSWMLLVYAAGAGAAPLVSALVTSSAMLIYLANYQLSNHPPLAELLSFGLLAAAIWALGAVHRRSALRIRQRAEDRTVDELRAGLARQRNRIARELHDVLGHYVSAIVVQAGAARSVAGTEPDVVREAIGHIEESGRRIREALPALLELQSEAAIAAPVRLDKDGVEALVAPLRSAGLSVTIEVRSTASQGDAAQSPDEVELFAQRILMEALTNVLRHASSTPTHVRLDHQADALTIEVADAGPVAGHRPAQDGGGHGLVGMRERAELLGGELSAGRHGERGWLVQARLPRTRAGRDVLLPADDTRPPGKSSLARTRDKDSPP